MPEKKNIALENNKSKLVPAFIRTTGIKNLFHNIKKNILLILSLYVLLMMQMRYTAAGKLSLIAAAIVLPLIFSQFSDIWDRFRQTNIFIKIYSVITAIGICRYTCIIFVEAHSSTNKLSAAASVLGLDETVLFYSLLYISLIFSCIGVVVICSLFIRFILDELSHALSKLTPAEKLIYSAAAILSAAYVVYAFTGSRAFWGGIRGVDIIYTSDSANLVQFNAYLRLLHDENDIRQPLFAVFAAPFIGFGYALSLPFAPVSPAVTPVFMGIVQIILFLLANYLLSVCLELEPAGRICFMLIFSATYTYLLFSVMMEQYIVCYFWIAFAIYSYLKDGRTKDICLTAAGGTLLTSFALLPLNTDAKELRRFPLLAKRCIESMLFFLIMLLGSGRADVLFNLYLKFTQLSEFIGGKTLYERVCQYTSFAASCFVRPEALACSTDGIMSWVLSPDNSSHLNIAGLVIIALCVVGFILNRKEKIFVISGLWCCFSALLLCIVGWGSPENGMILYSLYFGWSFYILLFGLICKAAEKTGKSFALPAMSAPLILLLALINYHGIAEMFAYAFKYYPLAR